MSSGEDSGGTQRVQREAFNKKKRKRIAKMAARNKRAKIEVEELGIVQGRSRPVLNSL